MDERPLAEEDRSDMQALIGSGLGSLTSSEYLLLRITSGPKARAWLQQALAFVRRVSEIGNHPDDQLAAVPPDRKHEAWTIAFTFLGLQALGIAEDPEAPFPSEFRSGQADDHRRRLLREDPAVQWQWGDAPLASSPEGPVSMLVARLYDARQAGANPLLEKQALADAGLEVVRQVHGPADHFERDPDTGRLFLREPFGFRDGIGQPRLEGLRRARGAGQAPAGGPDPVPLGEFVLGHPNAYGELAHCPAAKLAPGANRAASPDAFGRNGCYLAVQQIVQHVDAFIAFEAHHARPGADPAEVTVVEKMMGRRKEGQPLQAVPAPAAGDAFRFRVHDPHGLQCPIGSHIRRANPRDSMLEPGETSSQAENLHRLLRRGRPFRAPAGNGHDTAEVGMFFIAIVADISRQFEFVKRVWLGNPRFGNLDGEVDPLLGRSAGRRFTIPCQPVGTKVDALPDLTTTRGGGYFFMPAYGTLQRIARGDYTTLPE